MKKLLTLCCAIIMAATTTWAQPTYKNPIIPGFNPDPSFCRVGDDYYLVTSSFEYFPGVPVYHSKDLVNWDMIGHVLSRPSQLNLDNAPCSGGIYAPTIRYNKGTFYMITTLVGGSGNFVCTATDPAGSWSEPHWIKGAAGIDPSLFFDDDGKVYYCGNISPRTMKFEKDRNIWVQQLDIERWELTGPRVELVSGAEYYNTNSFMDGGILSGVNNYEAPHIYKKGGQYYLVLAHGGTSENHAVSIWASDNIFGPYRINPRNPILTHRNLSHSFPITSTGHADLMEVEDGSWWAVYLAKRPLSGSYIMGRETFMSPVDWSGEWPIVNPNGYVGKSELTHPAPSMVKATKSEIFTFNDEFNTPALRPEWTFIRTPRTTWWNLSDKKDNLRIALRPETIADQAQPSFVAIRQQHYNFTATTKISFAPTAPNEEAGLVIERDNKNYAKFVVSQVDGKPRVSLIAKRGDEGEVVISTTDLDKAPTYLRMACNGYLYTFYYSYDNKTWTPRTNEIDGRFLGTGGAGRFTGTFLGLYASSNGAPSTTFADFDWFKYVGQ